MAQRTSRKKGTGKGAGKRPSKGADRKKARAPKRKAAAKVEAAAKPGAPPSLLEVLGGLAQSARGELGERIQQLAAETGALPLRIGRALLLRPENPKLAREAGAYLRELRELAGLTRDELSDAIDLEDHSLLDAVENGTSTLSFELILRLASILARHDPVPFVIRFTRSYNPELWRILEEWGVGRLPLQYSREREFLNVYRRHDAARKLSDEGFARVLAFTRSAFELSLHFIADEEHVVDQELEV
jgi:transcriptional regulator with XRE-family HTH domain